MPEAGGLPCGTAMLGELRSYLKQRGTASLSEIAAHFDTTPDAAELALGYWIRKGKVRAVAPPCSESCYGCTERERIYQWIMHERPVQWHRKEVQGKPRAG